MNLIQNPHQLFLLPKVKKNEDKTLEVEAIGQYNKAFTVPKENIKQKIVEDIHDKNKAKEEGHSDIETFPIVVSPLPKIISEDLHTESKEDAHTELIEPKIIAEDLKGKEENHQHSELIEPKIIAEDLKG